jgi:hypothetical protein
MDTEFIMVAKTMFGLEELLAKELEELSEELALKRREIRMSSRHAK